MTVAKDETDMLFSLRQLAEITGMHRNTVAGRIEGMAPRGQRRQHPVYHLADVATAIFAGGAAPMAGPGAPKLSPTEQNQLMAAKLKQLTVQQRMAQLLPVEQVHQVWAEVLKALMTSLETLPDILEREVRLQPHQVSAMVQTLDQVRDTLAQQLAQQVNLGQNTKAYQGMPLVK